MWRLVAIIVLQLFCPAMALAAVPSGATTIVLLRPATSDSTLAETLTRVQGELVADGFVVSSVSLSQAPTREELLAQAARRPDAAALVSLFAAVDGQTVELWVVEQQTGQAVVTRVEVSAANPSNGRAGGPEVLARRAVEVLRATLLELAVVPTAKQAVGKAPQARPTAPERMLRTPEPIWGAEVGVAAIGAVRGPSLAVMPVVRLRLALDRVFMSRLSVAGFGTRATLERAEGTADIDQQLALLELVSWLTRTDTVRPAVGLGAGAYHVSVEPETRAPYLATPGEQWAVAVDAFAGVSVSLRRHWALDLELHAMLSAPYPLVRFVGVEVARLGRPSFLCTLTLAGWL